jgi:hypothetical protein
MPDPRAVLALPLGRNDAGANTVGGYLIALLREVWVAKEGFSGKHPWGNSSWEYDLYKPLIRAGYVNGELDPEYGWINDVDWRAADKLIDAAIDALTPQEVHGDV